MRYTRETYWPLYASGTVCMVDVGEEVCGDQTAFITPGIKLPLCRRHYLSQLRRHLIGVDKPWSPYARVG